MSDQGTRQGLLEAAVAIVAESGLKGLTHRAIAARAGVSHGLVRHYFGTIDELLLEAMQIVVAQVTQDRLRTRATTLSTLSRDLGTAVQADVQAHAFITEMLLEARRQPQLRHIIESMYDTFRASTQDMLAQRGIDGGSGMAILVFAALDGLVIEQQALGRPKDTQAALAALQDLLQTFHDHHAGRGRSGR